jgi:hypothetical protein
MRGQRKTLIFAAVLACAMPLAVSAAVSPSALLGSILGVARSQRSVHYVSAARVGASRVSQVGDAGVSQGIQRITFRTGNKTGHVTVIVSAGTAYVRGDALSLVNYMGFNATAAARYAGVWVLIPHSDRDYATVAYAVTLSSTIAGLTPSGPLVSVPATKVAGQQVLGVRGKTPSPPGGPGIATLYARANGSPLPVEEVIDQGNLRGTITLVNWNQPVHVATPTHAVPISTTGLE